MTEMTLNKEVKQNPANNSAQRCTVTLSMIQMYTCTSAVCSTMQR